jgi:hypothetical protein
MERVWVNPNHAYATFEEWFAKSDLVWEVSRPTEPLRAAYAAGLASRETRNTAAEWFEEANRQRNRADATEVHLRVAREVIRAASDFLPQESTSGGISREDWRDLRLTLADYDRVTKP